MAKKIQTFLVSYNQEKFIEQAVTSVLQQDYPNLEIIISDDCSTDNTFKIIERIISNYKGPHKIIINRNQKNMGIVNHLNFIKEQFLNTDYLIGNSGDDIQEPNRVSRIVEYFEMNPDVYAVCHNSYLIDKNGIIGKKFVQYMPSNKRNFFDVMKYGTGVFGAGAAYRMEVFNKFGNLKDNARNEDQILPYRAAILGKIGYIDECLNKYRHHDTNLSFWVKYLNASFNKFIDIEILNIKNQIENLKNLINDLYQVGEDKYIRVVSNKIKELEFQLNLLTEKNILSRLLMAVSYEKKSKKIFLMALSRYLYYRYTKYYLRKKI